MASRRADETLEGGEAWKGAKAWRRNVNEGARRQQSK
jgi:hypothetical protein